MPTTTVIPSESPYSRAGSIQFPAVNSKVFVLEQGDTAFGVAHLAFEEWRLWRSVLDRNEGVSDALFLNTPEVNAVEVSEAGYEWFGLSENFTPDYCVCDGFAAVTLRVSGDYGLQASSDGGVTWGDVVEVDKVRLFLEDDPAGDTLDAVALFETGGVSFSISKDQWLALWLTREVTLLLDVRDTRTLVVV